MPTTNVSSDAAPEQTNPNFDKEIEMDTHNNVATSAAMSALATELLAAEGYPYKLVHVKFPATTRIYTYKLYENTPNLSLSHVEQIVADGAEVPVVVDSPNCGLVVARIVGIEQKALSVYDLDADRLFYKPIVCGIDTTYYAHLLSVESALVDKLRSHAATQRRKLRLAKLVEELGVTPDELQAMAAAIVKGE